MEDLRCKLLALVFFIGSSANAAAAEHWYFPQQVGATYAVSGEDIEVENPRLNQYIRFRDDAAVPSSRWLSWHTGAFHDIASQQEVDVLVLPPQTQAGAFSPTARALFAMMVNDLFERNEQTIFQDQFLLAKAFGNAREIGEAEAKLLAQSIGARRIIETHVGHIWHPDNSFDLILTVRDHQQQDSGWSVRSLEPIHVPMQHADSPFETFKIALAEARSFLQLKIRTGIPAEVPPGTPSPLSFDSPEPDSAYEQAYHLQLMGGLVPHEQDGIRKAFFARSLHLLWKLRNTQGRLDAPIARAYRELGMIAAARKQIEGSESRHCYSEALRANPNRLRDCAKRTEGTEQILLLLDAYRLTSDFEAKPEQHIANLVASFANHGDWFMYLQAYLDSFDRWNTADSSWIKRELDRHYPVEGDTFDNVVRKYDLSNASHRQSMLLAPIRHYKTLLDRRGSKVHATSSTYLYDYDKLDLLLAMTLERVHQEGYKLGVVQSVGRRASDYADRVDSELLGHPVAAYIRALAHESESKTSADTAEYHLDQVYEFAARAYVWSAGPTATAESARRLLSRVRTRERSTALYWSRDLPEGLTVYKLRRASGWEGSMAFDDFSDEADMRMEQGLPLDDLEEYFLGHPQRNQIFIDYHRDREEWSEAIAYSESQLEDFPDQYSSYANLADIHMRQGKAEKAASVFAAYPPFKEIQSGKDRVLHGNQATDAGTRFFTLGHPDLARQFYEISANYPTGSGSHYIAETNLCQLDGDFVCAAGWAQRALRRYGGVDPLITYMNTLMMSEPTQAETVLQSFDTYISRYDTMIAWVPAQTSQRLLGWNNTEILDWLRRENLKNPKPSYARLNHYVRMITTDRTTPEIDFAFVREEVEHRVQGEEFVWSLRVLQQWKEEQYKDAEVGDVLEIETDGGTLEGVVIASELEFGLRIFQAVTANDFAVAAELAEESLKYYAPSHHTSIFIAWAFAETGKLDLLDEIIEARKKRDRRMHLELASALLEGYRNNHNRAFEHLTAAIGHRLGTGNRFAVSPYLIAKTIDILWEKSGHEPYRKLGLSWARAKQVQFPGYAWQYALVAKLTSDPQERLEAARRALYLDARSAWLRSLPQEVIEAAKQENANENPFADKFNVDRTAAEPTTPS